MFMWDTHTVSRYATLYTVKTINGNKAFFKNHQARSYCDYHMYNNIM